MTTAQSKQKLDHYKLETTFHKGYVVHTTYQSDPTAGQRKAQIQTKWTEKQDLDSGGFGIVSLQQDEGGQLRAVKRLPKGMGSTNYSQELKALSKISDREDLFVKFFGWYDDRYFLFIAMEYIQHGDLSKYIKTPLARNNVKEITKQLLKGLAVLHERDICHRDLKPQNILIASQDPIWVKIADFGISKDIQRTQLHTRIGTPGYLAPEIQGLIPSLAGNEYYTNAVDIWALGSILYEILTSQIPFLDRSTISDTEISGLDLSSLTASPQTDVGLLHRFCLGTIGFPVECLKVSQASDQDIAFVKSLLVPDPRSRLSAVGALQSPWFSDIGSGSTMGDVNGKVGGLEVAKMFSGWVVIAVDFGAISTAVAYMCKGQLSPTKLDLWPGCNKSMARVPTTLRYITNREGYDWGFVANNGGPGRSLLFKTWLHSGNTNPDSSGKSAYEMIEDFLNAIYGHLSNQLEAEGLGCLDKKFAFTYPDSYSRKPSKSLKDFQDIIKKSLFGKHNFQVTLTQPQAAAIHGIYSSHEKHNLEVGGRIMICNVGGVTAEVQPFQILDTELFPLAEPIGEAFEDSCGSSYADKAFEEALYQRKILQQLSYDERHLLLQEFINSKMSFLSGEDQTIYYLKLPRDDIVGEPFVKSPHIEISKEMMSDFFELSITRTVNLLKRSFNQCSSDLEVKHIVLSGELGSSNHFKHSIEHHFADKIVIQPVDSESAVLYGCIRDLVGDIPHENCPAHYGIVFSKIIDSNLHKRTEYNNVDSKSVLRDQIYWFIKKGAKIHENELIRVGLQRTLKKQCTWNDILVRSDSDVPPTSLGPVIQAVKFVYNLETKLKTLPERSFMRWIWPKAPQKASYSMNVVASPAGLRFETWHKEMRQSQALLSWDAEETPSRTSYDQSPNQPFLAI